MPYPAGAQTSTSPRARPSSRRAVSRGRGTRSGRDAGTRSLVASRTSRSGAVTGDSTIADLHAHRLQRSFVRCWQDHHSPQRISYNDKIAAHRRGRMASAIKRTARRMPSVGPRPASGVGNRRQLARRHGAGTRLPGGCIAGQTHAADLLPAGPRLPRHGSGRGWISRGRRRSARHGEHCEPGTSRSAPAPPPRAGPIVRPARNRVNDGAGPPGEISGSALARAETYVLARLPFRGRRDLVLTTTLQWCLQCAGAIRPGPIATVRFAGPDRYWDGCHDFGKLSAREARRTQPARIRPRRDELGTFATLISRFVRLPPACEQALRAPADGPAVCLVHELEGSGEVERLAAMDIAQGLGYLRPRLGNWRWSCPAEDGSRYCRVTGSSRSQRRPAAQPAYLYIAAMRGITRSCREEVCRITLDICQTRLATRTRTSRPRGQDDPEPDFPSGLGAANSTRRTAWP